MADANQEDDDSVSFKSKLGIRQLAPDAHEVIYTAGPFKDFDTAKKWAFVINELLGMMVAEMNKEAGEKVFTVQELDPRTDQPLDKG